MMELKANQVVSKPTTSHVYLASSKASSIQSQIQWKFSKVKRTYSQDQEISNDDQSMTPTAYQEFKANSKYVPPRSHHSAVLYQDKLYVYGGYQNELGILDDFLIFEISQQPSGLSGKWTKMRAEDFETQNYPGKRHSHTVNLYNDQLILFGGKTSLLASTNQIYSYSLSDQKWSKLIPKNPQKGPKGIDSHEAVVHNGKMIVFGGFQENEYSKKIYSFDFKKLQWSTMGDPKAQNRPEPRGDFSMVLQNNKIYIYAGSNSQEVFNDLWQFDIDSCQFRQLADGEPRSSHSAIIDEKKMIVFGGIKGITHEKDDLVCFDIEKGRWVEYWKNSEEKYTESFKPLNKTCKGVKNTSIPKGQEWHRYHLEIQNYKEKAPRKYRRPIRQEKAQQMQKQMAKKSNEVKTQNKNNFLLSQFQSSNQNHTCRSDQNHSPLMESLHNSILMTSNFCNNPSIIKNDQHSIKLPTKPKQGFPDKSSVMYSRRGDTGQIDARKQKKQMIKNSQINDSYKLNSNIISARDGHSCHLLKIENEQFMVIFGGNRHMASYNELFLLNMKNLEYST